MTVSRRTPTSGTSGGFGLDDAVIGVLFRQSPTGLHIYDAQLRLVRVNTGARFIHEFPVDRMLGRPMLDVLRTYHADEPEAVEQTAREVLETGVPALDVQFRVRSPEDPVREHVTSASFFQLQQADGTVQGLASVVTDVTERVRTEGRLRLLNRATAGVGRTLDVFRTAQELCDIVVPELADVVTVDVLDSVLRGDAPAVGTVDVRLPLRRAASRSVDDEDHRHGPPAGAALQVCAPCRRDVLPVLEPELVPVLRPDHAGDTALSAAGVHSVITVPLRARGVVLGLVSLYRSHNPVPFDRDDLGLAEQLSAGTALCLDNARLYHRERSVARIVQRNLRQPASRCHAAVETAHVYVPAGAGGGWFDVIPLSGSRVALAAGDTTGRFVDAAAAMGELRAAVTALSELDLPPDEILARLHDLTSRFARAPRGPDPEESPDQTWPATCVYAVYDPVARSCSLAAAAHPPPALVLPDGDVELIDIAAGPPLGQGVGEYPVTERTLPVGSTLAFYNPALLPDGAGARPRHIPLDELHRVVAAHSSLRARCDALADALLPKEPRQDAILLLARTRALDADRTASWTLPNDPRVVNDARRRVAGRLSEWGLDDLGEDTALVVSELVTNAVRYAKGPIELRLVRDQTLTCEVTDDSSTAPQLRRAVVGDEGGRGLFITAQLTERWGVRPTRRGKTVWAELRPAAD
ncbi:SpoIIE family protein phosphatase [Streptomyces sp. MK7]|uniref:SpoIIE family protein phosphatase n=1 Tax=Streptomyces sp. MK7 TaxID=3067635 RepID=UPI00292D73CE|nr:SpoIIE family protein phosphatase [Streptomyces sp. MK7]